ncbi:MAG: phosphotransferase, partial [Anaerolineaceae bacterium]|nr:phosphotransferase [Anaerolineaceae bacterium]
MGGARGLPGAPVAGRTDGFIFFKASIPLLARELALTQVLYRRRPDCTLPVLAADLARGWMPQPDGSPVLRSFLRTPDDLRRVDRLLPSFAELQIELVDQVEELLPLVPFDRRLDRLPECFEQLLADRTALQVGLPAQAQGLSEEQLLRLRGLLPRFQEMCAQLSAAPIPPSLHHDDFHDANIFMSQDNGLIISDWAESCVTHPFFSMLILLR